MSPEDCRFSGIPEVLVFAEGRDHQLGATHSPPEPDTRLMDTRLMYEVQCPFLSTKSLSSECAKSYSAQKYAEESGWGELGLCLEEACAFDVLCCSGYCPMWMLNVASWVALGEKDPLLSSAECSAPST